MSRAVQLAFDLGTRSALGAEDFLVSDANAEAVAWIDRWPGWPVLALTGPAGAGKSHLGRIWQGRSAAATVTLAELAEVRPLDLAARAPAFLIDDADGPRPEEQLLHALNAWREQGRSVLLTGREPPARWAVRLPDLASRLAVVPVARLQPPDDALLGALLVKLFHDRQLRPPPAVIGFLLRRMERSHQAAADLVARLDAAALAAGRPLTLALARAVLAAENRRGPA